VLSVAQDRQSSAPDAPALHTAPIAADRNWRGRLELLVMQPTPFCNLDCTYCYLPDRANRSAMTAETVEMVARRIFAEELPGSSLGIVWHAGEPLVVAPSWYQRAFAAFARHAPAQFEIVHHFQTNAVLIDERWCALLRAHRTRVGVSIDGPAWLHDRQRRTRDGRGTHARVMGGIEWLRREQIPFHAICVLTRDSLAHADALFDFFAGLGCTELCLNVEEVEGANRGSSLAGREVEPQFRRFFDRIVERWSESPARLRVREIDGVLAALRDPRFGHYESNSQNQPGRLLSVGWDGSFATYSPELLGQSHPKLGALDLGNVATNALVPGADARRFDAIDDEIAQGVRRCRATCKHFDFCLGGAPANKLGETGSFATTQTMHCRLSQQVVTDSVLGRLEQLLDPRAAASSPSALR
jgi:uncharacterized protein